MGWWFGRILTFEIFADEEPATVAAILNEASNGLIACNDPRTVIGYAVHGRSIRAALEPLIETLAVQLFDDGSRLRSPSGNSVNIDAERDLGAGAGEPTPRHQRGQVPASQIPAAVRLSYYDPLRDFQFGEARASASDESRIDERRDFPAVIDAGTAKAIAHEYLARSWAQRDRLTVRLPTRHLGVEPGAHVDLPFTPSGWIVERCTMEAFACVLELRPSFAPVPPLSAEAGRILQNAPDVGEMAIALFEAPPTSENSDEPTILLAASSADKGWRSAAVEVRTGAHRFAERTARRKSILGRPLTKLGPKADSFEVELVDGDQWLVGCDEQALADGANLAMLGSELIQFGEAVSIGPGKFTLRALVRGWGATGPATPHEAGEAFVLMQRDALRPIAIPAWARGPTVSAHVQRGGGAGSRSELELKPRRRQRNS